MQSTFSSTTFLSLLSVTDTEIAKTNTSFWKLRAISGKMSFFLVFIAFSIVLLLFIFNDVIANCQGGVFPVLFLFLILFFFFFVNRLGGLIGMGQSGRFLISRFWHFGLGHLKLVFFTNQALSLHFCQSDMRQAMTSGIVGIHILNYNTRPSTCLGLFIDGFLYYFFKTSEHVILLLHFDFDKGFEAFPEVSNYSWLIRGLNIVKFH